MSVNPGKLGMKLGAHLSIAGGIDKSANRAKELNVNAFQIFSHNVRSWSTRDLREEEVEKFKRNRVEFGIEYVVAHTSYLLNLASPKDELWEKSKRGLIEEVRRADRLGIAAINTHIGAHTGSGIEAGLTRLTEALKEVIDSEQLEGSDVRILLENTSGSGTTLGANFAELGEVLDELGNPERFGICIDTCHGFAAGYDFGSRQGLRETLAQFEDKVGLDNLRLIHLNDSVGEKGSNKDRHAHIGQGKIGDQGFSAVVNAPELRELPFILETPKEEIDGKDADRVNLDRVMELRS
ncbi:MAG: deoxyribonuclease IV [Candidatus Bipolaricaulota bacterium]